MSVPIVIGGKKIGRMRASFLLFKETFRFFWADKEMIWVPVITGFFQLFIIGACGVALVLSGFSVDEEVEQTLTGVQYVYILLMYIMCAFTIAYSQATITHIVYTRVHGGDATLWQGLKIAGSHVGALFIWASITSTVGILLRMVAERSQLLVRILIALLGAMWSVLTYFVVPAIVIDGMSPVTAIGHSGNVFKRTWGETFITNISLGFAFIIPIFVLIFVLIGFHVLVGIGPISFLISLGVFSFSIIVIILLSSVLDSVLRTLLYVYASEQVVPHNFNRELLESILARKTVVEQVPSQTAV